MSTFTVVIDASYYYLCFHYGGRNNRYIPLFTADTYWHRLSKGHIVLSQCEVSLLGPPHPCCLFAFSRQEGTMMTSRHADFSYTSVAAMLCRRFVVRLDWSKVGGRRKQTISAPYYLFFQLYRNTVPSS